MFECAQRGKRRGRIVTAALVVTPALVPDRRILGLLALLAATRFAVTLLSPLALSIALSPAAIVAAMVTVPFALLSRFWMFRGFNRCRGYGLTCWHRWLANNGYGWKCRVKAGPRLVLAAAMVPPAGALMLRTFGLFVTPALRPPDLNEFRLAGSSRDISARGRLRRGSGCMHFNFGACRHGFRHRRLNRGSVGGWFNLSRRFNSRIRHHGFGGRCFNFQHRGFRPLLRAVPSRVKHF